MDIMNKIYSIIILLILNLSTDIFANPNKKVNKSSSLNFLLLLIINYYNALNNYYKL